MAEHRLSDYLVYGPCPPGKEPYMSVSIGADTMHLMVAPKEWPRDLFLKHKLNVLFLFRDAVMGKEVDVSTLREGVCLCCDISSDTCAIKVGIAEGREKRDCTYYTYGVCIPATRWANEDRMMSMTVLGILRGATRQRVNQVLQRDYQSLYEILQNEPVIREILESIYQDKDMTPDEIVARVMNGKGGDEDEAGGVDVAAPLPD